MVLLGLFILFEQFLLHIIGTVFEIFIGFAIPLAYMFGHASHIASVRARLTLAHIAEISDLLF